MYASVQENISPSCHLPYVYLLYAILRYCQNKFFKNIMTTSVTNLHHRGVIIGTHLLNFALKDEHV